MIANPRASATKKSSQYNLPQLERKKEEEVADSFSSDERSKKIYFARNGLTQIDWHS